MANRAIYGPPGPTPPAGVGGLLGRLQSRRGGLLGSNPLTYMGLGLLSQGPSLIPQSPWQGLGAGLGMYGAMQDRLATQDFRAAKLDLEREKMEAEQRRRDAAATQAEQQRAAQVQRLIAGGMDPAQASNVVAAGAFDKFSGPAKPEALKVVVGEDGKPRYVPASEAIGQEAARTPPISLTMGAPPEPLGEDAAKWRNPDGSPVSPGTTMEEAIAAGATPLSAAELETEKFDAMLRKLDEEVARSQEIYDTAAAEFQRNPNAATKRTFDEAANRLSRAKAGRANPRGEPSGDVARDFRQPGALGSAVEGIIDYGLGRTTPLPNEMPPVAQPLPEPTPTQPPPGMSQEDWDELQMLRRQLGG